MSTTHIDLSSLEADPRLFLYTSLTAGSSHIITATSRLETILKANKIPFQAIDTATDEKARRLWQRRASGKKLPGLVKEGFVVGDLEDIEEWNEFGELKEKVGPVPANNAAPPGGQVGVNIAPPLPINPTATAGTAKLSQPPSPTGVKKSPAPVLDDSKQRPIPIPLPAAAEMAARNSKTVPTSTPASEPAAKDGVMKSQQGHRNIEHLSAPASRLHSGTATPAEAEGEREEEEEVKGAKTGAETGAETTTATSESKDSKVTVKPVEEETKEMTSKSVEPVQSHEAEKTQQQSAKDGEEATKSVED
ncbi:hypothetical protein LTR78_004631 [Recurvomyces mirabilis]|uniref:Uncharacterized protein n=1 Tax=Recurvomyces mirabilis TaxID=574656 RepID=A0AAE1C2D2_9PEZI|nr:hypothetical protein LTR78_004631 [Recurvomyces mirabilis]KAK5152876.1 hypothetical protein LTS14_007983 [Recurvomyces mirabilis]